MSHLSELDSQIQQATEKRNLLAQQIEACDADLEVMQKYRAILLRGESGEVPSAPANGSKQPSVGALPFLIPAVSKKSGIRESIRQVFPLFNGGGFTVDSIVAALQHKFPEKGFEKKHVASELWKMARVTHEIEVAEEGSGNRPHLYKKGENKRLGVLSRMS